MKEDKLYRVIKDIPLMSGSDIRVGTYIRRTHGTYYMNGLLLPPDYQQDFDDLIENESKTEWKYLVPVVEKTAFNNSKEDL